MLMKNELESIFTFKQGKQYLLKRESSNLEFKKSFHKESLAEYGKDLASFANNSGGYIVFGVKDSPHIPIGLPNSKFADTDESIITEFMNQHFAPAIEWRKEFYHWNDMSFGLFCVPESKDKPVIAICDGGKEIKCGEIYYRYIGRSEKIKYAELKQIIEQKIASERGRWEELFKKIGRIGPNNAIILDTLEGKIEENGRTILIDDELVKQIKFIKEGEFKEKEGAITLKLVGDVSPVSVAGIKTEILHDNPYIFRAKDVAEQVEKATGQIFRPNPEHVKCWKIYEIRGSYDQGSKKCNKKYCDYFEKLSVFMYTQEWIDFLIKELSYQSKLDITP